MASEKSVSIGSRGAEPDWGVSELWHVSGYRGVLSSKAGGKRREARAADGRESLDKEGLVWLLSFGIVFVSL